MPSSRPFLDHPGPLAFAHRGGAGDSPENTLPAFENAVQLGYRHVETDVHVTADGVLLAFHDDRLDRVTDRTGAIVDLPWREVAAARVDGTEPIPTLEELLGSFPDLRINIDPKADGSVEPLIEVIERTGAIDRVCVGSFSDRRITRIRSRLGPRLCTSPGPRGIARLRAAATARFLPAPRRLAGRHGCVQVPVRGAGITIVEPGFIDLCHRLDLQVHVWTIDDPDEMHRLLDLGVDGIMTDRVGVLKDVLAGRDAWPLATDASRSLCEAAASRSSSRVSSISVTTWIFRCTSGPSTTPTRCTGSSTWAWTAS
jgi:glycerophosphoryl diester phosphodiesterase